MGSLSSESLLCMLSHSIQRRQWHPTPVLLPGKSHGWRSLVGFGPWGLEESNTTERLHFHFSLSCIGEGNGNSLQYSCLENPRDRGAWWASVYRVTQSQTWLMGLSSSSSNHSIMSNSLRSHGQQSAKLLCPWTFSRQEYWSGLPFPPPGYLPNPGIEPTSAASPVLQVDSLPAEPSGKHPTTPLDRLNFTNTEWALLPETGIQGPAVGTSLVGPVAWALRSQGRGPGFNPWLGNEISHAATKTQCSQINTNF